jgi:hypothetical protein
MIIALSAAALIAAAPAVLAQGVPSKAPVPQHKVNNKHHPGVFGYAPLQAKASKKGYPGAFGYAPREPGGLDRDFETSLRAGGGGGGGM